MKFFIHVLLSVYRSVLSPDHSWVKRFFPYGFCRFYPTCSVYMEDAVNTHGFLLGFWWGCARMLRCNPWNRGGIDHVKK